MVVTKQINLRIHAAHAPPLGNLEGSSGLWQHHAPGPTYLQTACPLRYVNIQPSTCQNSLHIELCHDPSLLLVDYYSTYTQPYLRQQQSACQLVTDTSTHSATNTASPLCCAREPRAYTHCRYACNDR